MTSEVGQRVSNCCYKSTFPSNKKQNTVVTRKERKKQYERKVIGFREVFEFFEKMIGQFTSSNWIKFSEMMAVLFVNYSFSHISLIIFERNV